MRRVAERHVTLSTRGRAFNRKAWLLAISGGRALQSFDRGVNEADRGAGPLMGHGFCEGFGLDAPSHGLASAVAGFLQAGEHACVRCPTIS
jgi:hypothetical protein